MVQDWFSSHPPITPPTAEEDGLTQLRLIRSARVGPSTFHRLIDAHGSAQAALDALPEVARCAGVRDYHPCPEATALREIDAGRAAGARLLLHGSPEYPAALAAISDAPPVLWAIGQQALAARPSVALVGARNASSLGTRMARRLAEGLGHHGIVITSGLARGIDAAAHTAALPTGTVAIMAGGVDMVYPTENMPLYEKITETGLLLSEQPMGMAPQARHFPRRNRIVSGMALAVVVVEAAEKSGSLITAREALDQGREIMAVPGHPVDGRAAGCNRLIREGATLVRGVEDIRAVLRLPDTAALTPAANRVAARMEHTRAPGARPAHSGHSTPPPVPATARQAQLPTAAAAQEAGDSAPAARSNRTDKGMPPPPTPQAAQPPRATPPQGTGNVATHAPPRITHVPEAPESTGRSQKHSAGAAPVSAPPPGAPAKKRPQHAQARPDAPPLRNPLHARLLALTGAAPVAEDQLIRDLAAPAAQVLGAIVALELEGVLHRHPGGLLTRR